MLRRKLVSRLSIVVIIAVSACDSPVESLVERELWNGLGIRNYEFVYTVGCFCGFTGPNPTRLTVRDGVVVRVQATDSAVVGGNTPTPAAWPTIDSLFALVDRARGTNPAVLKVEYDDTYHFPKVINFDPVAMTADDEVTYRVEQFKPAAAGSSQ
ncbi:MAG: DUF6174 domain-containing protein [Gemmatimonadales bacterium]